QQSWLQCAVEQYVDQGNRVTETCRLAATDVAEAVQPAAEPERPATEPKPAAHRQTAPEIKHAA
ncbi:MAG: hypothetical protein ACREEP_13620, partial [Dongiaceae bacterium]